MKKSTKILSFILALVMIFALAVPSVSAVPTGLPENTMDGTSGTYGTTKGKITITHDNTTHEGTLEGRKFKLYQLLILESYKDGGDGKDDLYAYKIPNQKIEEIIKTNLRSVKVTIDTSAASSLIKVAPVPPTVTEGSSLEENGEIKTFSVASEDSVTTDTAVAVADEPVMVSEPSVEENENIAVIAAMAAVDNEVLYDSMSAPQITKIDAPAVKDAISGIGSLSDVDTKQKFAEGVLSSLKTALAASGTTVLSEKNGDSLVSDTDVYNQDYNNGNYIYTREISMEDKTADGITVDFKDDKKSVEISGLPLGYYLVEDISSGDDFSGDHGKALATVALTTTNSNAEINLKEVTPVVDKKVVNNKGKLAQATSVSLGDTIKFRLTGVIPDTRGYSTYTYTLTDNLTNMTLNKDSIKVAAINLNNKSNIDKISIGDNTGTTNYGEVLVENTNYTLSSTDDYVHNFKVDLSDIDADTMGGGSSKITRFGDGPNTGYVGGYILVEYTATLDKTTSVELDKANPNSVVLEYSTSPSNVSEKGTDTKKVDVYTHSIEITKHADGNQEEKLSGAKFRLYKEDASQNKYYFEGVTTGSSDSNNERRLAKWSEANIDNSALELETDSAGIIKFLGLGAGTYYLEETKAPDGYNKLTAPVKIELLEENVSVSGEGSSLTTTITYTNDKPFVANRTGTILPETGGVGRVIIYVVGAALALGAAALFVMKRHAAKEAK